MNQTSLFDPPSHDQEPEDAEDLSQLTREEIRDRNLDRMIKDLEAMGVDFSKFGGNNT